VEGIEIMFARSKNMMDTILLREPIQGRPFQRYSHIDKGEGRDKHNVHPFWAPFSWIMAFAGGALFWYWIIDLLVKL
jgi:hypothetical protein